MRPMLHGVLWVGIYLILIIAPLLVLLIGPIPPGRGFWREFSVGMGFVGLSMMGLQFLLTGRFKHITSPYGIDVVYHFHRQISLIGFALILLHPVLLFVWTPETLLFLNPFSAPWWMTTGTLSLLVLATIIFTSIKRKELGLRYEPWRLTHGFLSIGMVALSLVHIEGVGYYVQGPLKRGFWIALVSAWIFSLVYIRILKPLWMFKRPYIVEEVRKERGKTWTLVLRPEGHSGMSFKPGQFAWLKIGKSPFAIREHPFSFSSSSMKKERIEISIKELGDFTSTIGNIPSGTKAYLDGPYGSFTIDRHKAPGYVFIAEGVNRAEYEYFVCGPDPMQIAVKRGLEELGLPLEKIESESFNFV